MTLENPFGKPSLVMPVIKPSEGDVPTIEVSKETIKLMEDKPSEEAKEEAIKESRNAAILREHGGLPSNIPVNHPYWQNNNGT